MHILTTKRSARRGQSLVEILVALGIGVILIGGVTALITVNLRSSAESKANQAASSLTQEVIDGAKSKAEADWNAFYLLGKTSANKYYIASSTLAITAGTEQIVLGEYTFTRYFYIDNVNRTQCGTGVPTEIAVTGACSNNFPDSDIAEDSSTQKITVVIEWVGGRNVEQTQYVSRIRNAAIRQTDWSGGVGDETPMTNPNNKYVALSGIEAASTTGSLFVTINSAGGPVTANMSAVANEHWAWNDMIGWIDLGYGAGNVGVNDAKMFGYASSSIGLIAFDCSTTPNGDICGGTPWRVTNSSGTLTGWAYSDAVGWISFDSPTAIAATGQGSASYGVTVAVDGTFSGFAWNETIGWISFNCANSGLDGCDSFRNGNYVAKTAWSASPESGSLTSPVFDLGDQMTINAITWKGVRNGGGVRFQVAVSNNAAGPWNYKGPDSSSGTYYDASNFGQSAKLSPKDFSNMRYIRYKIFIDSNIGRTASPDVQDVVINYSF